MTALWVVNFFYMGIKRPSGGFLYDTYEQGWANSVPAPGVNGRIGGLAGFMGFKGWVVGLLGQWGKFEADR